MKTDIHPENVESHVRCTCGNEFTTRSTKPELHVEICSNCHPFYTGRQKLVDTGGPVERFRPRAAKRRLHLGSCPAPSPALDSATLRAQDRFSTTMPRRLVIFAALALALIVPGQAQAAYKLPASKLLECKSGDA